MTAAKVPASRATDAYHALYTAEGSDWFWWFGEDQDSGSDEAFDDLFRIHLRNAHRFLDLVAPAELDVHIVPHSAIWSLANQIASVQRSDRLVIRTNCPGKLNWRFDDESPSVTELKPVGGVMAGLRRYELALSPFSDNAPNQVHFRFQCTHRDCDCADLCCRDYEYTVRLSK